MTLGLEFEYLHGLVRLTARGLSYFHAFWAKEGGGISGWRIKRRGKRDGERMKTQLKADIVAEMLVHYDESFLSGHVVETMARRCMIKAFYYVWEPCDERESAIFI